MKVQFKRPHSGAGIMGSIGYDIKIVDIPDGSASSDGSTTVTSGTITAGTILPDGTTAEVNGTQIDETTPIQDWTWDRLVNVGGGAVKKGN